MEIIGIVLVVVFLVLGVYLRQPNWQDPQSTPAGEDALQAFEARDSLFVNQSEQALFSALERHRLDGFYIMAKVRLEDILEVKRNIKDKRLRWKYRGRVKSRHVDFAICDGRGRVLCAIELDGSAHKQQQAQMVDGFKDTVFKNAGLKLLRINTGADFDMFSRNLWRGLP